MRYWLINFTFMRGLMMAACLVISILFALDICVASLSTQEDWDKLNEELEEATRRVTEMCVAWFGADACFCNGDGHAVDTNGDTILDSCESVSDAN